MVLVRPWVYPQKLWGHVRSPLIIKMSTILMINIRILVFRPDLLNHWGWCGRSPTDEVDRLLSPTTRGVGVDTWGRKERQGRRERWISCNEWDKYLFPLFPFPFRFSFSFSLFSHFFFTVLLLPLFSFHPLIWLLFSHDILLIFTPFLFTVDFPTVFVSPVVLSFSADSRRRWDGWVGNGPPRA